jgi:hypothetical protein
MSARCKIGLPIDKFIDDNGGVQLIYINRYGILEIKDQYEDSDDMELID